MNEQTQRALRKKITSGRPVTVHFTKRTTGKPRTMKCVYLKDPNSIEGSAPTNDLIRVFDLEKQAERYITLPNVHYVFAESKQQRSPQARQKAAHIALAEKHGLDELFY